MRVDLITDEEDEGLVGPASDDPVLDNIGRRWLAFPKTIRLSTCLRSASGDRSARISRSAPMPNFIFNNKDDLTSLSDRLAAEVLVPLFRKLHPEKGYNVCLINIAATNIADAASEKGGPGRDIAKMFRRQDGVLKQWKVDEAEEGHLHVTKEDAEDNAEVVEYSMERKIEAQNRTGSEDLPTTSQEEYVDNEGHWESEDDSMLDDDIFRCEQCGATMPVFAMAAHYRWHAGHSN
jgi:DNA polymerase iota